MTSRLSPEQLANIEAAGRAEYELFCRHCIGHNKRTYYMPCDLLGVTPADNAKVRVYGERYWRGKDHIARVRYVRRWRVVKKRNAK